MLQTFIYQNVLVYWVELLLEIEAIRNLILFHLFISFVHQNLLIGDYGGVSLEKQLVNLISSDKPDDVQLAAADW